jgi:hypothetical protein
MRFYSKALALMATGVSASVISGSISGSAMAESLVAQLVQSELAHVRRCLADEQEELSFMLRNAMTADDVEAAVDVSQIACAHEVRAAGGRLLESDGASGIEVLTHLGTEIRDALAEIQVVGLAGVQARWSFEERAQAVFASLNDPEVPGTAAARREAAVAALTAARDELLAHLSLLPRSETFDASALNTAVASALTRVREAAPRVLSAAELRRREEQQRREAEELAQAAHRRRDAEALALLEEAARRDPEARRVAITALLATQEHEQVAARANLAENLNRFLAADDSLVSMVRADLDAAVRTARRQAEERAATLRRSVVTADAEDLRALVEARAGEQLANMEAFIGAQREVALQLVALREAMEAARPTAEELRSNVAMRLVTTYIAKRDVLIAARGQIRAALDAMEDQETLAAGRAATCAAADRQVAAMNSVITAAAPEALMGKVAWFRNQAKQATLALAVDALRAVRTWIRDKAVLFGISGDASDAAAVAVFGALYEQELTAADRTLDAVEADSIPL